MLKIKKPALKDNSNGPLKPKINNFLISYFGYLILAAAGLIFAAGLWLFVYPQYRQIARVDEAAREKLRAEYEAKSNYLDTLVNLKKSYQSISEEDKNRLAVMVPAGSDVNGLIYIIESIALKNGVILNSLKIESDDARAPAGGARVQPRENNNEAAMATAEQLPQGAGRVKIEVSLSSANYPILKNIIKTFENNLRLLDIAKINYNVAENRVALTVYGYYLAVK